MSRLQERHRREGGSVSKPTPAERAEAWLRERWHSMPFMEPAERRLLVRAFARFAASPVGSAIAVEAGLVGVCRTCVGRGEEYRNELPLGYRMVPCSDCTNGVTVNKETR